MPFNGSGTFNRIFNWQDDADNNIDIEPDRMDGEDDGFATGLSNCIAKDGQTTITANIPLNNHKLTGLLAGSAVTDSVTLGQSQINIAGYAAGGGTADVITATFSPAITALTDGMIVRIRASAANATTTPTFSPNGLTAHTITKYGNQALIAGDIFGAGHDIFLEYNLIGTRWELLNPSININSISLDSLTRYGAAVASASTVNLDTTTGDYIHITGTTTITAITLASGRRRTVVFDGILTLTHNATSLILPGGVSITTAAGDTAVFEGEGSSNTRCVDYTRASGQAIIAPTINGKLLNTQVFLADGTYTPTASTTRAILIGIGGGGGGGGSGTGSSGTGGNGGATTVGSILSVGGGTGATGGTNAATGTPGAGGTPTTTTLGLTGSAGGSGTQSTSGAGGGSGGAGAPGFMGQGAGRGGLVGNAGVAAIANTGAGGGGAGGANSTCVSTCGGGSGSLGIVYATGITGTYAVGIGTAGAAGSAGTSGFAGGAGGTGVVIIFEFS